MTRWLALALCTLFCLASPAPAAASTGEQPRAGSATLGRDLDQLITEQLDRSKIPGAAVVVVKDGKVVLAKGYGTADVASDTPVTTSTGFFTGSMAKVFTATAVMQLVDRGRIDLDADVNRYLEAFKIDDTYPGRPVTVRDLHLHLGLRQPAGRAQRTRPERRRAARPQPRAPPARARTPAGRGRRLRQLRHRARRLPRRGRRR